MKVFVLGLMSLLLGLVLVGCGGGSAAASGRASSVRFTVKWPAGTPSRVIPKKTQSIKVVLTAGAIVQAQVLNRPSGQDSSTANFANVPVGSASLTATAYPNVDATGTALATATTNFTVDANNPFNVTVTLDSTITHLQIQTNPASVGNALTVPWPDTPTIAVAAFDVNNNQVMVDTTEITITSSDPTVATVANGLITTLQPGSTTITARESSSGLSATLAFTAGPFRDGNYTKNQVPHGRRVISRDYTWTVPSGKAIDWYFDIHGEFVNFNKDTEDPQLGGIGMPFPTSLNGTVVDGGARTSDSIPAGRSVTGFAARTSGTSAFSGNYGGTWFPVERSLVAQFTPTLFPNLDQLQVQLYTTPSSIVDYNAVPFQAWLTSHGLTKLPNETSIDLARRIADAMHTSLTVDLTNSPQVASSVIVNGHGNCHGLSAVMVAALRANGIVARMRPGMLAKANSPVGFDPQLPANFQYGRIFSCAQLYHGMAGWVRIDGDGAATSGASAVGVDDGNFLPLSDGEDYSWKPGLDGAFKGNPLDPVFGDELTHVDFTPLFFDPVVTVFSDTFVTVPVVTTEVWTINRD